MYLRYNLNRYVFMIYILKKKRKIDKLAFIYRDMFLCGKRIYSFPAK